MAGPCSVPRVRSREPAVARTAERYKANPVLQGPGARTPQTGSKRCVGQSPRDAESHRGRLILFSSSCLPASWLPRPALRLYPERERRTAGVLREGHCRAPVWPSCLQGPPHAVTLGATLAVHDLAELRLPSGKTFPNTDVRNTIRTTKPHESHFLPGSDDAVKTRSRDRARKRFLLRRNNACPHPPTCTARSRLLETLSWAGKQMNST